jgi:hypothetical protein
MPGGPQKSVRIDWTVCTTLRIGDCAPSVRVHNPGAFWFIVSKAAVLHILRVDKQKDCEIVTYWCLINLISNQPFKPCHSCYKTLRMASYIEP